MYRIGDAAVTNVGYRLKSFAIGLSYDVSTSALKGATNGHGGFELSLVYVFRRGPINPSVVCPKF